jgi:acetyl-CoA/propionyl-CoA carboxylase biotin carboxyl carrier protein
MPSDQDGSPRLPVSCGLSEIGVRASGRFHDSNPKTTPLKRRLGPVSGVRTIAEGDTGGFHAPRLPFVLTKILIANRGEIAVRVIRAAREMGISTVAVYSELDRDALHVRLADEAYALGGQTAAESYLNTEAILDAIRKSGADGVHPGYGFFSENADFAQAITELGVTFIGPPADAIVEMGDKVSSRKAALRGGAPIVPGTTEFVTSADEITAFGNDHGWPIAIKAAFGGGGRGMKVVHSAAEVTEAMESAQREAKAFFGRDEIYVERYLTWPRHVEVQIVGDHQGDVVWVSTRDCSAQRRHQKLIEEAPAPGLPEGVEEAMGAAAVKAAKAVGYYNAGTVEFIYQDGDFFFLEMNTRLQVEHPVTEVITGIDLVEWQIRVASGEPLPMTQEEIAARRVGHGIEVRINAEDPTDGKFLPSPGRITKLVAPDGFGVRFDSGYESGDEVSQYYDNLVGKLIVWGKDRDTAIARTVRALEELVVEGVATTVPADLAILRHPDFAAVTHSTKWVEERLDLSDARPGVAPGSDDAEPLVQRRTTVEVNGKRFDVSMWVPETPAIAVAGAKATAKKPARAQGGASAAGGGSGEVAVPMQGTIVKVLVAVGDTVEAGQAVVVLEAMKMENQITADKAGTVSEIKVAPGDTVGSGDVVVIIS